MTRKFTFLLMALLALTGLKGWGQTEIQIGNGTQTQSVAPFYNYYNYSYAQMLYLGSEIGESGTITSISFRNSRTSSLSNMKFNIYMKCVSKDSYSGNSDWVVVTGEDLVYSATLNTVNSGWATFTLDTPFEYDNTQGNLMIAFDNNTGSCTGPSGCAQFYYTSTPTHTCIYYYNDYTHINPTNPTPQANGTTYQRPDIKIMMVSGNTINYATLTGGTISGPSKAEADATVTLTATPDHGYDFVEDSWEVTKSTGGTVDVTNNQFTMPDCDVTVSAAFTAQQNYIVNITDPKDDGNTTATLSATPSTGVFEGDEVRLSYSDLAEGYKFVNYVATNATTSEPIDIQKKWDGTLWQYYYCFTMPDADVNLTANVKRIRTITVAEMQHGSLSISPNSQYQQITAGETITITPDPDYGYELETLTINKLSGGTITPEQQEHVYTFEMPEDDVNIAATFTATGTLYTVTLPEETEIGRVSAYPADEWESSTEYFENDNVRLNVYVKNNNYHIKDVVVKKDSDQTVVDFDEQSESNYYFTMPADNVTVTVTFEENTRYLVSIEPTENGTVSLIDAPTGNSYYKGQQVKFNVTPYEGYVVGEVTYICGQTVNIWYDSYWGYYYFTMPEAAVTINASFVMGITVCDGTETDYRIPVFGSYVSGSNNAYQKNQFIFPATDLEDLTDSKITDLTFYSSNTGSESFPSSTWSIFMKEVDYTTPNSFLDWNQMVEVYNGTIAISDNELTIHLGTPFEYSGGNLMIGFRENSYSSYDVYTIWYGVKDTDVMHSIVQDYDLTNAITNFLPKTTIIYEPVVKYDITLTKPDVEVGTIAAYANGDKVSKASEGTQITLEHNFNLGYRFNYWTVNDVQIESNTFTMPAYDVFVAADYEVLTQNNIICADIEHGEIFAQYQGATVTGAYEGMQIDLVANLDKGYAVTGWIVNEQPIEGSSFIMPDEEVTVNATVIQRLELTVNDGTATNTNVPIYGLYADVYPTESEFIIPKESLTELKNKQLIGLTFYSSNIENHDFTNPSTPGNPTWKVYVKEVDKTIAKIPYEDVSTMTQVYLGTMKIQNGQLVVDFANNPVLYSGNNLMIKFEQQNSGAKYKEVKWYGITTSSNTALATNYYNTYWGQGFEDLLFQFLPKTTFAYAAAPQYEVTLSDVENGTIEANPMEAAAGATIQLTATPAEHYRFGSWMTIPEVEIDENNRFVMPEGGINVSATFISLSQYQINFMANGVTDGSKTYEEGATIDRVPTKVPSGMTFTGWVAEDIATFMEQAPVYTTTASQAMTLYAVFSYTDNNGATVWNKVTDASTLANNDQIIIACETNNRVLCQKAAATDYLYQAESVTINEGLINNVSDNAIIFTLESSGENLWKLNYKDNFAGNTSISSNDSELGQSGTNNVWMIDSYGAKNVGDNNRYISYDSSLEEFGIYTFGTDYYATNAAKVFKKGSESKTYYMTEVFVIAEATSLTENMTKRNIIIADGASLNINANVTLNVAGACLNPSHDAAQLVIAEGGQLIYNNAGTVATMKKNINCNASKASDVNWYTISSPLAESTEFANVTNLIPNSGVTGIDYDLYRLNEAEGIWENARLETGANPAFTTIDKGRGYIYSKTTAADIAFAGEVNVAPAECTLTNGKTNGFNLIGNPFMQNITLDNVTGVTLAGGFYVLTNQNTWGTEPSYGEIKPLQGFLVQATEKGGTARISKNASVRGERSKEQSTSIEMIVSNSNHRDNAFAMFGEGIGLNKVNHRNAEAPMLYIPQGGEDFAIAFMDENTTLFPLNFKAMTTGKYSISLKATDDINTLVLVDNMTGVETNMLLESSYSFIGSPADKENRFTVKLSISNNDNDENEQFVYQYGNELIIDGEGALQVFDVLGRVVISEEVHGQRVDVSNLTKGAYIVRMTGNEVKTQKIIVR